MPKWMTRVLDWFGGRYYVVEYDAFEVYDRGAPIKKYPYGALQCTGGCKAFGGSALGVFRSRRLAANYMAYVCAQPRHPVYPRHITRIPKYHPLVKQSIWR